MIDREIINNGLRLALVIGVPLFTSCAPKYEPGEIAIPMPTVSPSEIPGYVLPNVNGEYADLPFAAAGDPLFEKIAFSFDKNRKNGSIVIEICSRTFGLVRLMNTDLTGGTGANLDLPYNVEKSPPCITRFPAVDVGKGSKNLVRIGEKLPSKTCIGSHLDMRMYLAEVLEDFSARVSYKGRDSPDFTEDYPPANLNDRPFFNLGCKTS